MVGKGRGDTQVQLVHCTDEWNTGSRYGVKGRRERNMSERQGNNKVKGQGKIR
jgi:hypothetical protein